MTTMVNPGRMTERGALLRQLLVVAQQKDSWSLSRLTRVSWGAFTNIGTHHKIHKLLKLPPFDEAVRHDHRLLFKYLEHGYLARAFTIVERPSCFLHHYRYLHAVLPHDLLLQILKGHVTLHEILQSSHRFSITMGLSKPHDCEGELSLNLEVDGDVVFILSITIVPGWVIKSKAKEILLITRIQGVKGSYSQIQLATKVLHDVAPTHLLLAALQGVASALGIREIACINATMQRSAMAEEQVISLKKAYDAFFSELGIPKTPAGFFVSQIPIQDKPLTSIKQGHKLRTKEKRAFKQQVQLACTNFFA